MSSVIIKLPAINLFLQALEYARTKNENAKNSLSLPSEVEYKVKEEFRQYWASRPNMPEETALNMFYKEHCKVFISKDGNLTTGGFIVLDGELISLFSLNSSGKWLLNNAIHEGANRLDCFDGYLVSFYKQHGFKEDKRVANYTPGNPDVVYMIR